MDVGPTEGWTGPEEFLPDVDGDLWVEGITVSAGHLWDLKVDVEWAKISPENPRGWSEQDGKHEPSFTTLSEGHTCTTLQGPLQETEPLTAAPPGSLLLTSAALPAAATVAATSLGSEANLDSPDTI